MGFGEAVKSGFAGWSTWSGPVELRVGTSSRDITHALSLSL